MSSSINTPKKKRNELIDAVRGVAMLIVVYGHAIQVCNGMDASNPLHQLIRQFQMPLLMIVSGFVAALSRPCGLAEGLRKKAMRLLVPYLSWVCLLFAFNGGERTVMGLVNDIGTSDFWFLRTLFMISAVWLCVASLYSVDFVHSRLKSSGGRFFRPVWLAFSAGLWIVAMLLLSTLKSHSGILSLSLFYGLGYLLSRSGFFGRYGKLSVVAVLFFSVLFVSLNLAGLQSHVGFLKAIGGSCAAPLSLVGCGCAALRKCHG